MTVIEINTAGDMRVCLMDGVRVRVRVRVRVIDIVIVDTVRYCW
jgi:hypothetical protein